MKKALLKQTVLLLAALFSFFTSRGWSPLNNCEPACINNLLSNTGFEIDTLCGDMCGYYLTSHNTNGTKAQLCGWSSYIGHPSLFSSIYSEYVYQGSGTYQAVIPFNPGGSSPLIYPHDADNTAFVGLQGGYNDTTGKWDYESIWQGISLVNGQSYYLSFWSRDVGNSYWTLMDNPVSFFITPNSEMGLPSPIDNSSDLSTTDGSLPTSGGYQSTQLIGAITQNDPNWNSAGYFNVKSDGQWHQYTMQFVFTGATGNYWLDVVTPTYLKYSVPASSFHSYVLVDDIDLMLSSPLPSITGPTSVCAGDSATFIITDSFNTGFDYIRYILTDGSGTHTDSLLLNTSADTTQLILPVSGITTLIIDTFNNGCDYALNDTFIVKSYPPPSVSISGKDTICNGESFNIPVSGTYTAGVTVVHYTRSPGGGEIGTLTSSGLNTGTLVAGGSSPTSYVFTLTSASSGACAGTAGGSYTVTVLPTPYINLTDTALCLGMTIPVNGTPNASVVYTEDGGTPSSTTLDVNGNGNLSAPSGTGLHTVILTFGTYGCTTTNTVTVTVYPNPAVITGPASVCIGDSVLLSDDSTGGHWQSLSGNASANTFSGEVKGLTAGTATIEYYLLPNPPACSTTYTVTVKALPTITPSVAAVCYGADSAYLNYNPATGSPNSCAISWGTAAAADGFTGISGSLTGGQISMAVPSGTPVGSYSGSITVTNTNTCSNTYTFAVTVKSLPGIINGPSSVCVGQIIELTDTPQNGTWYSTSDAAVSAQYNGGGANTSTGVITGVTPGTDTMTYTGPNGCSAYDTITVDSLPNPGIITYADTPIHLCIGSTIELGETVSGGGFGSDNNSIAQFVGGGALQGNGVGSTTVYYVVTNDYGCSSTATATVTVDTNAVGAITGYLGVCAGGTTQLFDYITGGTWSLNAGSGGIASINAETGVITGISSGIVTATYTDSNSCGILSDSVTVVVNMPPYITTHSQVACETLADSLKLIGQTSILTDSSGCVKVCDSSVMRYYGDGVAGSNFTWSVLGGTIINNYGDSVDVLWPAAGIVSSITIYDTASPCVSQRNICIEVIQKPQALFAISPDITTPVVGPINICPGATENFVNLSTGDPQSPIVSYVWNFGDGSTSAQQNPSHEFSTSGFDTVFLAVQNACNCVDTYKVVFKVGGNSGSQFLCSTAVCLGDTVVYGFNDTCGVYSGYHYSVSGGTLVGGMNPVKATVAWNNVDTTTGFGYVNGIDPCSACPDTMSLKVPVIIPNATIEGPDTICAGQQYEYTLPLWPAVQYHWGVLDDTTAIVGINNDYKVVVQLGTTGVYTLHGWYQNELKLCGGNVFKNIYVQPPVTVTGNLTTCLGNTETYTINGGDGGDYQWALTDPTGAITTGTGSGYTLSATFATPGLNVLALSGAFCASPITINVQPAIPAIDSISSPDTVCLNRVYTYIAYSAAAPGSVCQWQITGGTITPPSGSDTVTVVWTGGSMQLSANRVSTSPPFCAGNQYAEAITQDVINPQITGDTLPCSNSYRSYTANYTRGETYDWTISPGSAGSIVSGSHSPVINVLWNNVTATVPVTITVIVHKCDSVVTTTLAVVLQPAVLPTLTGPSAPVCPGDTVTFTATAGALGYVWDFGDGSAQVTTAGDSVSHAFPVNPTTGNIIYSVKVSLIPDGSQYCPVSGTAATEVSVKPGPVAFASTADHYLFDGIAVLDGTVTNNVTGMAYQWYSNLNGIISGAVNPVDTVTDTGVYYFFVTADNGCSAFSNGVTILSDNPPDSGCPGTVTAIDSSDCNTIYLTGVGSGTLPFWYAVVAPPGGLVTTGAYTAYGVYDVPGIYQFVFAENFGDSCRKTITVADTIGMVPEYDYVLSCAAGGTDSVKLIDHTAYLPFYTIDSVHWNMGATLLGTGNNLSVVLAAPASDPITETVYADGPAGPVACQKVHDIALPGLPVAAFADSTSPICEGVAVYFTPANSANILNFSWNFGDGTSNLLQSPQRTYTWGLPNNPDSEHVVLTVTDTIGCTGVDSSIVLIYENAYSGIYSPDQTVCSNGTPVSVSWNIIFGSINTPTSYLWSNGSTTNPTLIYQSGAYWVTVTDAHQCQATVEPPTNVNIIRTPAAVISGLQEYCIGGVISLDGYVGPTGGGITYQWFKDSAAYATTPTITDAEAGQTVGDYHYQLVITSTDSLTGITCTDTSALFTAHVYGLPAPPVITGPTVVDCNTYHLQLLATEPVSGTYNWSNGTFGALDDIYTGGPYRVWFTNQYGCISDTDVYVPLSPDYYFPYFPSGCYEICGGQLPLTLYGPPTGIFDPWEWLKNATDVEDGYGFMSPYTITGGGAYRWDLNNGLCDQKTPPMDLSADPDCITCNIRLEAKADCTPGNPASYSIEVEFTAPASSSYTVGTDIGPVLPFSGTASGAVNLTLTFTTLTLPPPDSVTVEVYIDHNGNRCFQKVRVPLPECDWTDAEKPVPAPHNPTDSTQTDNPISPVVIGQEGASALMVYPNPSSGDVTLSYDFGTAIYKERMLSIYDALGQRMSYTIAPASRGTWQLSTANWATGVYMIRMEADGITLQTQRLSVDH